jgi:hypothetical protein
LRPEEHADNWDLRHEDFQDHDFLYDVYAIMRQNGPFAHTDTPFLSATPGGAWVATRAVAADADAAFHGNSVTRGYRQIPVVFAAGDRATQPA